MPRQEYGNRVEPFTQGFAPAAPRQRSASAGGVSVADYMRRTYRGLKRDTDDQNDV